MQLTNSLLNREQDTESRERERLVGYNSARAEERDEDSAILSSRERVTVNLNISVDVNVNYLDNI